MAKEVMKLGEIICRIDADTSYRKIRNAEKDFTVAKEKPCLTSDIHFQTMANNWVQYESASPKAIIRANPLGAEIINMCDGNNTIEDIAYELAEKYDLDDDKFLEQVKTYLNIFKTYHFIKI